MATTQNPHLLDVDWSTIPAPEDDGGADHLQGAEIADVALPATDGSSVALAQLAGRTVLYAYPRTGEPGKIALVDDWDSIPGARGCTPQSCSFRDHASEIRKLGVANIFGLSTQDTEYQREAVERLHLPFPLLSDDNLALTKAMNLPTMQVAGQTMIKRMALIIDDGVIEKVFYPVFPPDRNAADVVAWLASNASYEVD